MKRNAFWIDNEIAFIALTRRDGSVAAEAAIDADDLDRVLSYRRWYAQWMPRYRQFTARAKWGSGSVLLSRFVVGASPEVEVDHIDHNLLNARRNNLRTTTRAQNMQNRRGARTGSKTGQCNVYFYPQQANPYQVQIRLDGRLRTFGSWRTLGEAQQIAEAARAVYFTHSKPGHLSDWALAELRKWVKDLDGAPGVLRLEAAARQSEGGGE